MRIRCIKPEFWADERIASWSPMSRLAYIALWNEADDEGRLRANEQYLRSRLFPYEELDFKMNKVLQPLIEDGKLILYQHAGETYGYLPNFNQHQVINRPSPSRLPPPPASDSVRSHVALTEDSRGKGKEGKGTWKGEGKVAIAPARPVESQLAAYFGEIGVPAGEAAKFLDHYEANGWRVGKNPMQDWQAAARQWKRRMPDLAGKAPTTNQEFQRKLAAYEGGANGNH